MERFTVPMEKGKKCERSVVEKFTVKREGGRGLRWKSLMSRWNGRDRDEKSAEGERANGVPPVSKATLFPAPDGLGARCSRAGVAAPDDRSR